MNSIIDYLQPLGKVLETVAQLDGPQDPAVWTQLARQFLAQEDVGSKEMFLERAFTKQTALLFRYVSDIKMDGSIDCQPTIPGTAAAQKVYQSLIEDLAANYAKRSLADRLRIAAPEGIESEHYTALMKSVVLSLEKSDVLEINPESTRLLALPRFKMADAATKALQALCQGIQLFALDHLDSSIKLVIRGCQMQDSQLSVFKDVIEKALLTELDLSYNQLSVRCLDGLNDAPVKVILTGNPITQEQLAARTADKLFFTAAL